MVTHRQIDREIRRNGIGRHGIARGHQENDPDMQGDHKASQLAATQEAPGATNQISQKSGAKPSHFLLQTT
ncbi:hypothetical protein [Oryzibacter oryziterrae]|uniref:hypothetical protein n=1 Tax=Oryzibacter oryziterrae TaxID=2766474 RepID=UPI001F34B0BB|nr:hypothetical protein [Oryzibacter oryziterrae]